MVAGEGVTAFVLPASAQWSLQILKKIDVKFLLVKLVFPEKMPCLILVPEWAQFIRWNRKEKRSFKKTYTVSNVDYWASDILWEIQTVYGKKTETKPPSSTPGVGKGVRWGNQGRLWELRGWMGVTKKISSVSPVPAFPSSYMLEVGFSTS